MKFLSLAQLFGERRSQAEGSRKSLGRKAGKQRPRFRKQLWVESLEGRDLLTAVPLPTPLVDVHTGLGIQATGGTGGTSARLRSSIRPIPIRL